LRNRNFLPYLVGNTLSGTGTWFQILAQSIVIYDLTGSTFLLGVVGFASYGAVFLLAPVTGRVADRYDRQKVLMATQLIATLVTGVLCLVTATGEQTPAVIICFAFVLGISNAFATPAAMAFVPSLVQQSYLSAALALNSVTYNLGRAVGPVLAAVVIASFGPAWAFGINSLSYLAVVAALLMVHPLSPHRRPDVVPRLMDSVRIVLHDRRLAFLLYTIAAISLATDPPITLGPAYMVEEYGHAASLAGLLIGAFGTGAVIAAFTVAHRLRGTRVTLMVLLLVTGVGLAFFAVVPGLGLGLAGLAVMGFGYLSSNTAATSQLQLGVDPLHRGRMMVLWSLAFLGARPVGSLIDGSIAAWAGVRVATLVMCLPALGGAAVLFVVGLRGRRYAQAPR
jgi:predicted MFS family arabinose efflux permease